MIYMYMKMNAGSGCNGGQIICIAYKAEGLMGG